MAYVAGSQDRESQRRPPETTRPRPQGHSRAGQQREHGQPQRREQRGGRYPSPGANGDPPKLDVDERTEEEHADPVRDELGEQRCGLRDRVAGGLQREHIGSREQRGHVEQPGKQLPRCAVVRGHHGICVRS
jgi:hypothetical protein